jgi:hypothetical protein
MGMDPNIFRPLQKRDDTKPNFGTLFGRSLVSIDSTLQKRQQEVDSILNALAQNNPEDAAAAKQSLIKREDDTSDEAAALLAAEIPEETDTEASKDALDADVLSANGLNSDFTKKDSGDSNEAQSQTGSSDSQMDSMDSQDTVDTTTDSSSDDSASVGDESEVEKRNVGDLRKKKPPQITKRDIGGLQKAQVTELAKRQGK